MRALTRTSMRLRRGRCSAIARASRAGTVPAVERVRTRRYPRWSWQPASADAGTVVNHNDRHYCQRIASGCDVRCAFTITIIAA